MREPMGLNDPGDIVGCAQDRKILLTLAAAGRGSIVEKADRAQAQLGTIGEATSDPVPHSFATDDQRRRLKLTRSSLVADHSSQSDPSNGEADGGSSPQAEGLIGGAADGVGDHAKGDQQDRAG